MSAYAMLGVEKSASNAELKRAYREMAIKVHPDKGGDADQFQELQRAYESIVEERKVPTPDPAP
jgi:DnaJ-class molecular chaperone